MNPCSGSDGAVGLAWSTWRLLSAGEDMMLRLDQSERGPDGF